MPTASLADTIKAVNLFEAIRSSWSYVTTFPRCRDKWHKDNPALGQCAVTALLLQELLGGVILHNRQNYHYWNKLDDGREIDMTLEQFGGIESMESDGEVSRDYLLNSDKAREARTFDRLQILKARVLEKWTALGE